jgi:cytochrome P450
MIAQRFLPDAKPQRDMMGSFIRHGLNQEEASGEALLQVVAGSDTSAATIRVVLLNLMSAPLIYQRLQSEIDSATANGKISSPITDAEAKKLPYLQAVIKEGLRITPPATGLFPKTVPEGGDVLNGIFVPGGTQIGTSSYGIHHSKKVYGEDADVFRPERWLEAEGDTLADMQASIDLIFHYGKWQCLGKPVALMELNKIYVELLRRFDFAIVNVNEPAKFLNAGIWIISEFWVRVTTR